MNKTCNKCKQDKPLDQFYKLNTWNLLHNVDYYCKQCRNAAHYKSVKTNNKKCTIEGCVRPHYAKGTCAAHYEKAKRDAKKRLDNIKTFHDIFVDPQGKYKEW